MIIGNLLFLMICHGFAQSEFTVHKHGSSSSCSRSLLLANAKTFRSLMVPVLLLLLT